KIYRCATAQHARWLHDYLQVQARLISQVNVARGGTAQAPPWAIAPVHVIPPGYEHHDDGLPATSFVGGSATRTDDDDAHLLPSWFGVPNRRQPDCYVLALSPWLQAMRWPDSTAVERRTTPGTEQLPELQALAASLDCCHGVGIVHSD